MIRNGDRVRICGPARWKISGKLATVKKAKMKAGPYNFDRSSIVVDGELVTRYIATKFLAAEALP